MPTIPDEPNQQQGYESPGEAPGTGGSDESQGFSAPTVEALGVEDTDQEMEAMASEFGADLMALR